MPKGGFKFLRHASWNPETRSFLGASLAHLFKGGAFLKQGHRPPSGHRVPGDFLGVCVASSADPACDDYVVESLERLRVRHVRLDYSYDSSGNHVGRLLSRLNDRGFEVLLHLVQPMAAASEMETPAAQQQWRRFVADTLDTLGDRVVAVEVGSTINRPRWAGYSLDGFVEAWKIAFDEAAARGMTIAGPNVTDYEPLYIAGFLRVLRDCGRSPAVYTNNLFVERAVEPEAYDPKVLGATLAGIIKYNLIKKARLLQRSARRYGVTRVWNGYVTWTLPRIGRLLPNTEDKQADYLVRYLVLNAASGAMDRVYWGPLISFREGLIDDPLSETPDEELVTFYGRVYGPSQGYRPRPAFYALRQLAALIPGSVYQGRLVSGDDLEVHGFLSGSHLIHVVWTRNGRVAPLADIYPQADLDQAQRYDRVGDPLPLPREVATEAPIYLLWPAGKTLTVNAGARVMDSVAINLIDPGGEYFPIRQGHWRGMVLARDRAEAEALFAGLHPDRIGKVEQGTLMRKARNAIWTIPHPLDRDRELVVKQPIRLAPYKKLRERFKPSKARCSWNGACELLRRGIESPKPVAYIERADAPGLTENWYFCERHPTGLSARNFFDAYKSGESRFQGYTLEEFLSQLVPFLLLLHKRRVEFRDLSGGNVLVEAGQDGRLSFSLIDTARAHFHYYPLTMVQRLSDMIRICYKLHWEGRIMLMERYLAGIDRSFTLPYRVPFYWYDLKHNLKRRLKGKHKRRRHAAKGA